MLKTVDVLIGVSVVMLIVSMAVTVLTHFWTSVVNSRGRNLKRGLVGLLQQIDPTLPQTMAAEIVAGVLKHPLIAQAGGRLGTVIHREELTQLLLELASGDGPQKLGGPAQAALMQVLEANGISDPGATLRNIRQAALQLELAWPGLANNVRKNLAILHEGGSDFVAKVNAWFDQTIDRISERFTSSACVVTFVAALLVALVLQLDAVALINRLSMDDAARTSLAQASAGILKDSSSAAQPDRAYYDKYYGLLVKDGLLTLPQSVQDWRNQWRPLRLPGILLSAMLLSLGAPFWYNALKNLIQLRSVIAGKDDAQRQARQSPQGAADGSVGPPPPTESSLTGQG
ncbi:MAG: hypothetical protein ACRD3T_00040 [Terriglobia bacterium]